MRIYICPVTYIIEIGNDKDFVAGLKTYSDDPHKPEEALSKEFDFWKDYEYFNGDLWSAPSENDQDSEFFYPNDIITTY